MSNKGISDLTIKYPLEKMQFNFYYYLINTITDIFITFI